MPIYYDPFDKATFENDPTEYHLVCTDIDTGKAVYKQLSQFNQDTLEWIRASCSIPLLSTPVNLEGHRLLDGGITDSIPLQYLQQKGFTHNVVILTQPAGYVKQPLPIQPIIQIMMHRRPQLCQAMKARPAMYNAQLSYVHTQEKEGKALVIRPDEALPIRHLCHNPAQMQNVYDIGRRKGKEILENVKTFLKQMK